MGLLPGPMQGMVASGRGGGSGSDGHRFSGSRASGGPKDRNFNRDHRDNPK